MRLSLSALLLGLLLLGLTPATAWGQPGGTTPYTLDGSSKLTPGCSSADQLSGTFDLRALAADPVYERYAIQNVEFLASELGRSWRIVGSGTYRAGGAPPVVERMTLDLSIDGGPMRHFDSGDVRGGADFPHITIALRLHDSSACTDTVLTIAAAPGGLVGIGPRAPHSSRISARGRADASSAWPALRHPAAPPFAGNRRRPSEHPAGE